jgi:hypothetical protein
VPQQAVFRPLFYVLIAKILLRKEVDLDGIFCIIASGASNIDATSSKFKMTNFSSQDIAAAVLDHPQKLLMSLCSSLGMIAWSIGVIAIGTDASETQIYGAVHDVLCVILDIFIEFIRHGSAKLRAATCKSLLLLCYFPLSNRQSQQTLAQTYLQDEIFGTERTQRLMDVLLTELSKPSAKALSTELAQQKATKTVSDVSSYIEKVVVTSAVSRDWRGHVHYQDGMIVAESQHPSFTSPRGDVLGSPFMSLKSLQRSERRIRNRGIARGSSAPTGALHTAIALRHRPMKGGADDLMLLRLYLIVIWMMTVNRNNSCFVVDSDTNSLSDCSNSAFDFDSGKLDSLVSRLEVAIDDTELLEDDLLALLPSPVICDPSVSRQRLFKGYRNAANTLAADVAKYLLLKQSRADAPHVYNDAMLDRLAWLAAADVKYFILPEKAPVSSGVLPKDTSASPQTAETSYVNMAAEGGVSLINEFISSPASSHSISSTAGGVLVQGEDGEDDEDEI